ncbi:MAG: hypothetical protein OEY44_00905 [Candidatus Peregrinibacteria bacterium]|nr:hypothetical protein [Candidatus Peregrinibacteria bacterium]
MDKLKAKIMEKIRKEDMTPRPRWHFALRHILLGTAILSTILIGSLAVAIVIRQLTLTDWELIRHLTGSHIKSAFAVMPYIWILFIGITLLAADRLLFYTKKGHRVKPSVIALATVALSLTLGTLAYGIGADEPVENTLRTHLLPYKQWEVRRQAALVKEDRGLIAGEIQAVTPQKEITIRDFRGREWKVDLSHSDFSPEIGMQIGMIGRVQDKEHFEYENIRQLKRDFSRRRTRQSRFHFNFR